MSILNELDENDQKIYSLIAHAEDLQKICDNSVSSLDEGIKRGVESLNELTREIEKKHLATTKQMFDKPIHDMDKAVNRLQTYPALFMAFLMIITTAIFYFSYQIFVDDLAELRNEKKQINMELSQTANVIEDPDGFFWVEISKARTIGESHGKIWAKMPKR